TAWVLPKSGGTPARIALDVTGIAMDADAVYWASGHSIVRMTKADRRELTVLGATQGLDWFGAIAVDGTRLYFVNHSISEGEQVLFAIDKGAGSTATPLAQVLHTVLDVVADSTGVYWVTLGPEPFLDGRVATVGR